MHLKSLLMKLNVDNYTLVIVVSCILETNYDGVYWHDDLDIYSYSAPRGVIVLSKLDSWSMYKVSN